MYDVPEQGRFLYFPCPRVQTIGLCVFIHTPVFHWEKTPQLHLKLGRCFGSVSVYKTDWRKSTSWAEGGKWGELEYAGSPCYSVIRLWWKEEESTRWRFFCHFSYAGWQVVCSVLLPWSCEYGLYLYVWKINKCIILTWAQLVPRLERACYVSQ